MRKLRELITNFLGSVKRIGAGIGRVSARTVSAGFGVVFGITGKFRGALSFLYDKVTLLYGRLAILSLRPFWHVVFSIIIILAIRSCFFVAMVVHAEEIIIENRKVYVIPGDNNDSVLVTEYDKRYANGHVTHFRSDKPVFRFSSQENFEKYQDRVAFLKAKKLELELEEKRRWWEYSQTKSYRAMSGSYPFHIIKHVEYPAPLLLTAAGEPTEASGDPSTLDIATVPARALVAQPVLPEMSVLEAQRATESLPKARQALPVQPELAFSPSQPGVPSSIEVLPEAQKALPVQPELVFSPSQVVQAVVPELPSLSKVPDATLSVPLEERALVPVEPAPLSEGPAIALADAVEISRQPELPREPELPLLVIEAPVIETTVSDATVTQTTVSDATVTQTLVTETDLIRDLGNIYANFHFPPVRTFVYDNFDGINFNKMLLNEYQLHGYHGLRVIIGTLERHNFYLQDDFLDKFIESENKFILASNYQMMAEYTGHVYKLVRAHVENQPHDDIAISECFNDAYYEFKMTYENPNAGECPWNPKFNFNNFQKKIYEHYKANFPSYKGGEVLSYQEIKCALDYIETIYPRDCKDLDRFNERLTQENLKGKPILYRCYQTSIMELYALRARNPFIDIELEYEESIKEYRDLLKQGIKREKSKAGLD